MLVQSGTHSFGQHPQVRSTLYFVLVERGYNLSCSGAFGVRVGKLKMRSQFDLDNGVIVGDLPVPEGLTQNT